MFHPLAYLVKLNIEMCMAHLIRAIALDTRDSANTNSLFSFSSISNGEIQKTQSRRSRGSIRQVSILYHLFGAKGSHLSRPQKQRDNFVFAQNSSSNHGQSRPPIMHQDSLSWIDHDDSMGFIDIDWAQGSSTQHDESNGTDKSRKSSYIDDSILPGRPERARLDSRGSEVC
jgi:hypothetical protein